MTNTGLAMQSFKKKCLLGAMGLGLSSVMWIGTTHAADEVVTEEPPPDYNITLCDPSSMTAEMCEAAFQIMCGRPDGYKFKDCQKFSTNEGDGFEGAVTTRPSGGSTGAKQGGGGGNSLMFSPSGFGAAQAVGFVQSFFSCKSEMSEGEKSLAYRRGANLCTYVGEYCSKKVKVGFISLCRTKKKTYCCFNSTLARIINVEGRKQLGTLGWGSAKNPKCDGFSLEEFNSIDMSKMDLSEFVNEVTQKSQSSAKSADYWEERNKTRLEATWQDASEMANTDLKAEIMSSSNPYELFNQPTDKSNTNASTARTVAAETQSNISTDVYTDQKQQINKQQIQQSEQAIRDFYK